MDAPTKKFLFDLLSTPSPTGFEHNGQRVWADYIRPFADTVQNDAYGNVWATIEGTEKGKSLMFEAHADEIGYMVKYVSKDGFLSVSSIGGSDVATARGRWVTFFGDKGEVQGIIGNTAIHIRDRKDGDKAPEVHDLFVDIGAKSDKDVEKMGIRVGHPGVYTDTVKDLGKNCIAGRAMDNRIGGFILTQVLKNLAKTKPKWTIHFVNAVQEEIGGHGAKMISHRLNPSAALVFDVCHSTDTPGIKHAQHSQINMNEGPTVTHGSCNHPAVVQRLIDTAKKEKIGIQHEATSRYSGTDTDQIFHIQEGIPSALVSIPLRYMHSVVEMIDLRDVDKAIKLLTGFAKSLAPKDEFSVKI
ncbi:MAG: M42 family metallopeptidase [bacterium]|nr:M42 family metallopeptidase [bacterium]